MNTPTLKEFYAIEGNLVELPFLGNKKKQAAKSPTDPLQHAATTDVQKKMLGTVKKYLGLDKEPGKSLSAAVLDLSDAVGRIEDQKYKQKVMLAFDRMVSRVRLTKQGEREMVVREAFDIKKIESWVEKHADAFVGIPNEEQAKSQLKTLIRKVSGFEQGGAGKKGKPQADQPEGDPKQAGASKAKPRNVVWKSDGPEAKAGGQKTAKASSAPGGDSPTAAPAAAVSPAAPEPEKPAAKEPEKPATGIRDPSKAQQIALGHDAKGTSGPGGDMKKIRDTLLKSLPKMKKLDLSGGTGQFARNMGRAANAIAAHLAHAPNSDPSKVKFFTKAWDDFAGMVGSYIPKKPGYFAQRKADKEKMV